MSAFFFWATWATVTNRPNSDISYTHNWPADELVGNKATTDLMAWSGVSIILFDFVHRIIGVLPRKIGRGRNLAHSCRRSAFETRNDAIDAFDKEIFLGG